jgi:hypothetical protein
VSAARLACRRYDADAVSTSVRTRALGVRSRKFWNGPWRLRDHLRVVAVFTVRTLDLGTAKPETFESVIGILTAFGGASIIAPQGASLELSGSALFGGRNDKRAELQLFPGSPLIRVHAFSLFGGVRVEDRPAAPQPARRDPVSQQQVNKRLTDRLARALGWTSWGSPTIGGITMTRSVRIRRQKTGGATTGGSVIGPRVMAPSAMAPLAIAASAVGALAIGRLAIRRAVIRELRAEEIDIGSLKVRELEVAGQRWPESPPPSTAA